MYIGFFALLTLGFICVMPEMTKKMANSEYWEGIDLIVPLALANYFIFLYMIPVGVEYYNKKTCFISIGTLLAALTNLVLNFVCIKHFGYKAAAYTTLISYVALFILHWIISCKFGIRSIYNIKTILSITLLLVIVAFIVLKIMKYALFSLILRYLIIICIAVFFWMKKNIFLGFLKNKD